MFSLSITGSMKRVDSRVALAGRCFERFARGGTVLLHGQTVQGDGLPVPLESSPFHLHRGTIIVWFWHHTSS